MRLLLLGKGAVLAHRPSVRLLLRWTTTSSRGVVDPALSRSVTALAGRECARYRACVEAAALGAGRIESVRRSDSQLAIARPKQVGLLLVVLASSEPRIERRPRLAA